MKRSEINCAIQTAQEAFARHHWYLPPRPRWDVTDFGLGDFTAQGLVLVNLAEQPQYCEKIMYIAHKQITPSHCHKKKVEDIICRIGTLAIQLYAEKATVSLQVNGDWRDVPVDEPLLLQAGERVTLTQGVRHAFWAESPYVIAGEVSTANDDAHDNFFDDPVVGRFSEIEEDAPVIVRLVSE